MLHRKWSMQVRVRVRVFQTWVVTARVRVEIRLRFLVWDSSIWWGLWEWSTRLLTSRGKWRFTLRDRSNSRQTPIILQLTNMRQNKEKQIWAISKPLFMRIHLHSMIWLIIRFRYLRLRKISRRVKGPKVIWEEGSRTSTTKRTWLQP